MNVSKELIEKAIQAKTAEELLAMAKAENIELTEEEAAKAFAELNKAGELSDEELDNVAGGCGKEEIPEPKYKIGGRTACNGKSRKHRAFRRRSGKSICRTE